MLCVVSNSDPEHPVGFKMAELNQTKCSLPNFAVLFCTMWASLHPQSINIQ